MISRISGRRRYVLSFRTILSDIVQVTKEEELGLNKRKKKFDIREEYYVSIGCDIA